MKDFVTVLKQVFGKAEYLLLFAVTTLAIIVGAVVVKNSTVLGQVLLTDTFSLWQKSVFLLSLIGSIDSVFGYLGALILLVTAILFAVNLCLLIFYTRKVKYIFKGSKRLQAVGIIGLVSGLLGIGCAACGSIVLTVILSSVGASSLILLLPLHGSEFGILGILLLGFSIFMLAKKIKEPLVC